VVLEPEAIRRHDRVGDQVLKQVTDKDAVVLQPSVLLPPSDAQPERHEEPSAGLSARCVAPLLARHKPEPRRVHSGGRSVSVAATSVARWDQPKSVQH
jgi:hypothetical protein